MVVYLCFLLGWRCQRSPCRRQTETRGETSGNDIHGHSPEQHRSTNRDISITMMRSLENHVHYKEEKIKYAFLDKTLNNFAY